MTIKLSRPPLGGAQPVRPMRLAGLDIASTTGLCLCVGETFTASSFRPGERRPAGLGKGEIDFAYEGRMARDFRDYLRAWLVVNEVEAVGIERPLQSNLTIRKAVVDTNTAWAGSAVRYEDAGGTTMATVFRIYGLVSAALETCVRVNIDVHVLNQTEWRSAFLGLTKAPKGTTNGSKWLKDRARKQCELLKIPVANADMADAVGIVWALRGRLNPRLAGRADDLFRAERAVAARLWGER